MIYDHVVGVDRNRPGGFEGPYDSNVDGHLARIAEYRSTVADIL